MSAGVCSLTPVLGGVDGDVKRLHRARVTTSGTTREDLLLNSCGSIEAIDFATISAPRGGGVRGAMIARSVRDRSRPDGLVLVITTTLYIC